MIGLGLSIVQLAVRQSVDFARGSSLALDFTSGNQTLDPRITFTRASSATRFDSTGTLVTMGNNEARFDYNPTTLAPLGLLVEEQRTNLLFPSENFTAAPWGGSTVAVTADTTAAPNGTTTADTVKEDSSNDIHRLNYGVNIAPVGVVTGSVFVKAGSGTRYPTIGFQSGTSAYASATFNLSTVASTQTLSAAYTGVSAAITDVGGGWYRCSITCTVTAASAFYVSLSDATTFLNGFRGAQIYVGDDTSTLIFWGAQLEAGAFSTSYIPTVASQVTRSADVAVMTGTNFSDWYNATEGTLYAEGSWVGLLTSRQAVIINNSASQSTNFISIQTNPSTATTGRGGVTVGGTAQATMNISNAYTAGVLFKAANAYQQDNFAFTVDGSTPATDTSGTLPIVNQMQLGAISATTANIWLRRIAYYPRRLANSELVALTS